MSNVKANQHQIGLNALAARNFTLTAEKNDGSLQLQRGVAGAYAQQIVDIDASGFMALLKPLAADNSGKAATTQWVRELIAASFTASLAGNGWQKLSSGLIIQWGGVPQVPAGGYTDATYPVPFPSAAVWTGVTAGGSGCLNSISSAGAGNARLNFRVYNNLPGTVATGSGFYVSVGY